LDAGETLKWTGERLLVVVPWLAGTTYFLPLIGIFVALGRNGYRPGWLNYGR